MKGNKFDEFTTIKRHIESINCVDQIKVYRKLIGRFNRKYKDGQLSMLLRKTLKSSEFYSIPETTRNGL